MKEFMRGTVDTVNNVPKEIKRGFVVGILASGENRGIPNNLIGAG